MKNGAEQFIHRLFEYRELIAEAYYNGSVDRSSENARGISVLQQNQVLRPRGSDTYAIHTDLRQLLDVALNKEKLYDLNTDFTAHFSQLEKLTIDLSEAYHSGRYESCERFESEIPVAVDKIVDYLDAALGHLRSLVENHFGDAGTLAEKKRQNQHYIDRTAKITESLATFSQSSLMDPSGPVYTDTAFINIVSQFKERLYTKLSVYRQHISDIHETLLNYLFEYRDIEKRTRKIRKVLLYMRRHPDYTFDDVVEPQTTPLFLLKFSGISIQSYPNVNDSDSQSTLADIAGNITDKQVTQKPTRPKGKLVDQQNETNIPLKRKPYQQIIHKMITVCKHDKMSTSAIQWYMAHPDDRHVMGSTDVWLQSVMETLDHGKGSAHGVTIHCNSTTDDALSGNILINDVEIVPIDVNV